MLTTRSQVVNVDRLELIKVLKAGLETHKVEFAEAEADYKVAVVKFMAEAYERAKAGDFRDLVLRLNKPENHEKDYSNIIDLLEVSVDATVQVDSSTFRAFYKGEWEWKQSFGASATALKNYLGGAGGAV